MKRMLFNATYQEELRVAMVEGQKLINFDIETTSKEQRRGNIYKGFITRVEPSLEACFVDYGMEKQGFLPFKEIDPAYLPEGARHREFSRLTVGTELIVQVEKDERGNKGAALTSYVTLPGRYLVLMPNNPRSGGVSRRIEGEERDELKSAMSHLEVPQGMSVIIRTAALGRAADELQWDLSYLLKLWNAITTASSTNKGAFLIYQESNLVIRSIRDHFSPDVSEVLIDMEEVYDHARNFMAQVMPNFVSRIKLYRDDVPLFSRFQIEHQIESAYSRTVSLPSGGVIVIDHTEALTSVDVNSAKANKGSDIEATALATNIEAADEISRQMRLRDLGGLIVIDFIDMENPKNQREVENFFKQQLGLDRARIQMGKLSKFGLLELSRQRLQASLEESSTIPCPRCSGVGTIRGTESTAVHVLRIIQEEVVKNSQHLAALHVQLPVEIATYLLNEKRDDVTRIESRMKVKIVLIPNLHLDSPAYKIRKISNDSQELFGNKLSYNLVETPDDPMHNYQNADKPENKKAMVQNIAPTAPTNKETSASNSLGKLWGKVVSLFKQESEPAKPSAPAKRTPYSKTNSAQGRTPQQQNRTPSSSPSNATTNPNKRQPVARPAKPVNSKPLNSVTTPIITKPVVTEPAIVEAISKPQIPIPRPAAQRTNPSTEAPVNQARQTRAPAQAKPTETRHTVSARPVTQNVAVANKPSTVIQSQPEPIVAASAPVIKPTPVLVPKPVKPEPIDLGALEMVATDKTLVVEIPVDVPVIAVKRYNEVSQLKTRASQQENIQYELVETQK